MILPRQKSFLFSDILFDFIIYCSFADVGIVSQMVKTFLYGVTIGQIMSQH